MRKTLGMLLRSVAIAALLAPALASAAKELQVRKPTAAEIGKTATCPVMNETFQVGKETPVIDYKGKAYFFCCDHCIPEFRKDPDRYAAAAAKALTVRKPTPDEIGKDVTCAVTNTPFRVGAETQVLDYKGKAYYFCCEHCVNDFRAAPDRYAVK